MAVIKKNSMTEHVFDGISALYAVEGGFTVTEGAVNLTTAKLVELPVSESSGVSINGGSPSTTVFRVHGLNAPWTSHITPGDAEITLQIPTYDENVMQLVYGSAYSAQTLTVSLPAGAVGGAAGVIHAAASAHTDCEPNANVEAMRVALDKAQIEARPVWKPMHKQPCYKDAPAYVNGVSEAIFKVGMCLPAGPYVSDDDVRYIVDTIKANIIG